MKKLLIIALLLLPVGAWGESDQDRYPPPGPDGRIPWADSTKHMTYLELQTPDGRAKQIREWAASGDICRVLGHRWVDDSMITVWPAPPGTPHSKRRCSICGKTETRRLTEWE